MGPPAAVIDTNVLVSGLISADADAPTVRIVDGMLAARFVFLLSEELLAEYRTVLLRPALVRLHGLGEPEVDLVLTEIALHAAMRSPPRSAFLAPDPGNQHLWDLLSAERGATLVTGDHRLLSAPPPFARVIPPKDFVENLGGR